MFDRTLSRTELEALFEKYKDVENINNIRFLGKISPPPDKHKVALAARRNPAFRRTKNDDDEVVENARIVLDFPSRTKMRLDYGTPFLSRFAVFVFNHQVVDAMKEQFIDNRDDAPEYIMGKGSLISYKIYSANETISDEFIQLVQSLHDEFDFSEEDEDKIFHEFQVGWNRLAANDDKMRKIMSQMSIISNYVGAGDQAVEKLFSENKLPNINEVELQGLVYMPPNIRNDHYTGERSMHFRLRVKRPDFGWVASNLRPEDGYDYFNILAEGDSIDEWYRYVQQGMPLHIEGAIEQNRLSRPIRMTDKMRINIARILNTSPHDEHIDELADYVHSHADEFFRKYSLGFVRASDISPVG